MPDVRGNQHEREFDMNKTMTVALVLAVATVGACNRQSGGANNAASNAGGNNANAAAAAPAAPAAAAPAAGQPAAGEAEVRALLDRISAQYATDQGDGPEWAEVFEPQLAAAINAEEGGPGADPFIDAQDYSPFRATYEGVQVRGDRALATAVFASFGKQKRIDYQLIRTPAGWKVFDVQSAEGGSLRERMMRPAE
jgi:hypothetical protein